MGADSRNIAVLAVAIVLSLVLGIFLIIEADIVLFGQDTNQTLRESCVRFDPELGWVPRVVTSIGQGPKDMYCRTNSLGFRGAEEVDLSKEQILVLGDSVAWGFDLQDYRQAFPYQLGELVDMKHPNIQVLNLAVNGYGIQQYYLYLEREINLSRPKLVIVVIYTQNDYYQLTTETTETRTTPLFIIRDGALVNLNPKIPETNCYSVLSKSAIINRLDNSGLTFKRDANTDLRLKDFICGTRRLQPYMVNMVADRLFFELNKTATEYGARLMFVISPSAFDYGQESNDTQFFRERLSEEGYDVLDYYGLVKASGVNASGLYISGDLHHYNPYGNQKLAQAVSDYIDKKGLLD